MPLIEKARIEVYIPDAPKVAYWQALRDFDREFTYAFGGATTIRGLEGSYLSAQGLHFSDRMNIVYTDVPFSLDENFETLSQYAEQLRDKAFACLEEEVILVTVQKIFHSVTEIKPPPTLTLIS